MFQKSCLTDKPIAYGIAAAKVVTLVIFPCQNQFQTGSTRIQEKNANHTSHLSISTWNGKHDFAYA